MDKSVVYDRASIDAEAAKLRALGYTDDKIEIREINGSMHALPIGDSPLTVEDRVAQIDVLCQSLFEHNRMIVPMYPWCLVLVCSKAQKIGLIHTPDKQNKTVHEGIVLATWSDKVVSRGTTHQNGVRVERDEVLHSEMNLGDRVLFHHFAGAPVPGWNPDRFRLVKERDWEAQNIGGIFAKLQINEDLTRPLEQLIELVHDATPEEGLAYYDSKMASLLKAQIEDRFLVVDRASGSVTLSGT